MLTVIVFLILLLLLYSWGTKNFDYWKKCNIVYETPIPFLGNSFQRIMQLKNASDVLSEIYFKYPNEKYVGIFTANTPHLVIRDPKVIKQIFVTEFASFHSRVFDVRDTEYIDPILKNVFFGHGDLWRLLRKKLSPIFTTAKLKAMFPLIMEKTVKLQQMAMTAAVADEVDIREIMARYTTDCIGTCGFGIDTKCLDNNDSIYRRFGKRILKTTPVDTFRLALRYAFPLLFKKLPFVAPEISNTNLLLVKNILDQRDYKPSGRNDFIDFLIEIKRNKKITGYSMDLFHADGTLKTVDLDFNDELLAAQVFLLFTAGFETVSSSTSNTLYELARHPECQRKCQDEIDRVLAKHDNKISYETISEMKYLLMALKESLRLHPPLGYLTRRCAKNYTIPGTKINLKKGMIVSVPLQALHTDEQYFNEPHRYRPERFSEDSVEARLKYVYMPFGAGRRICLGMQLGFMQSMAGLATLLHLFTVVPSKSTPRRLEADPASLITQGSKTGIPLTLIPRKLNM